MNPPKCNYEHHVEVEIITTKPNYKGGRYVNDFEHCPIVDCEPQGNSFQTQYMQTHCNQTTTICSRNILPCKIRFASSQHKLSLVHSSMNTTCVLWLIMLPEKRPSRTTPATYLLGMIPKKRKNGYIFL